MNETIEDIIQWIRDRNPPKYYPAEYGGGEMQNEMRELADRIEAAYQYERLQAKKEDTKIGEKDSDMNELIETLVRRIAAELILIGGDLNRAFDNQNGTAVDRAYVLDSTGRVLKSDGDNLIKLSKELGMESRDESK